MRWLFDRLFGAKLEARTAAYLTGLATARAQATRDGARRLVKTLAGTSAPTLLMGNTDADEAVRMPLDEFLRSHSLVSGASGSGDRKSTRLNSSHLGISYAVFCLKKKKTR